MTDKRTQQHPMNKQHLSLTVLLAAAPLAIAQLPGAPPAVEQGTPDATPGLSAPSATPRATPPPAVASDDEPAAGEPVPAPAAGAVGPSGNLPFEKQHTPPAPRRVQNELPAPVPVPVAPAPRPARASNRYFDDNPAPAATPALPPSPAPPRARGEQIIRDTKLKVLQSHYETALSEQVAAERALIDAADDKRPALETRLKGLKGFVERLEADIQKLAASAASDARAGADGDYRTGPRKVRTSAVSPTPADPTASPYEEAATPPAIRVPASRGKASAGSGREFRPPLQDEAAEPARTPAPARR